MHQNLPRQSIPAENTALGTVGVQSGRLLVGCSGSVQTSRVGEVSVDRRFFNVALLLLSVLLSMGLTGITANGALSIEKVDVKELRRQNALTRSVELRYLYSCAKQGEGANTDPSSHCSDSPNDESIEGVPANNALLAKWKAVEMFKVREPRPLHCPGCFRRLF